LLEEAGRYVGEMDSMGSYPNTLIANFVQTKAQIHSEQVKAYADKIKAKRAAEQKAKQDKISDKHRRKHEKEAKRKAEEIARLKEQIKEKFVDKSLPIDEILK